MPFQTIVEKIRRSYLPDKVTILFVGESAPASGNFFYIGDSLTKYTQRAFENALGLEFYDHIDFLYWFRKMECYLDDLSHIPVNQMERLERENVLIDSIDSFSDRLTVYSPIIVIGILMKIQSYIIEAMERAEMQDVEYHFLPFPGFGNQNRYVAELTELLRSALRRGIIDMPDINTQENDT